MEQSVTRIAATSKRENMNVESSTNIRPAGMIKAKRSLPSQTAVIRLKKPLLTTHDTILAIHIACNGVMPEVYKGININEAELFYCRLKGSAKTRSAAMLYDYARAIVKYASTCGAMLKSVSCQGENLVFNLAFSTFDEAAKFNCEYPVIVPTSVES